ncbi:MAG TPA: hypothetical protein VF373_09540 [Prolixibacteraceae bacterium]
MEKEKKRFEIELRSDEFQEIIQQSPRWMIRSGVSLILGLIVFLLVGSYFFRYPDVIKADIVVLLENIPLQIDSLMNPNEYKVYDKQSQIIGRISLTFKDARKVAIGQKVNIRFENFPYMEFGYLKGKVKNISLMPSNENYIVEVELPQDMKTNYDIQLNFSQEMKGSAEIITEDLRLIQRFLNPLKSLLQHRVSPSE